MIDFGKYQVLTFDCYGTLIDWETGLLAALKPVLSNHRIMPIDKQILELYADLESKAEAGEYIKYRDVLRNIIRGFGKTYNFTPDPSETNAIGDSLKTWKPFPDTVEALQALKRKYKLAVISNIDDDLFASTVKQLKVEFDWVITAEQAKSYKPSLNNFNLAIERMGLPRGHVLHVAQSLYHDIIPAKTLGLSTVWVNRRRGREGSGATPPTNTKPDLEVLDLKGLVSLMGLNAGEDRRR